MKFAERESIITTLSDTELQGEFLHLHRLVNVVNDFETADVIALEQVRNELERRGISIEPSLEFLKANEDAIYETEIR